MLPDISGGHSAYQNFLVANLRKYYPDPDSIARSTWDIIDRFWNLDLSFTDELMKPKYSIFGPKPRTPYGRNVDWVGISELTLTHNRKCQLRLHFTRLFF